LVYKAILYTQDHNYESPHFFSKQNPPKFHCVETAYLSSIICKTPKELVESPFPLRNQTWKETFCQERRLLPGALGDARFRSRLVDILRVGDAHACQDPAGRRFDVVGLTTTRFNPGAIVDLSAPLRLLEMKLLLHILNQTLVN
jgi:hypothetical protein